MLDTQLYQSIKRNLLFLNLYKTSIYSLFLFIYVFNRDLMLSPSIKVEEQTFYKDTY